MSSTKNRISRTAKEDLARHKLLALHAARDEQEIGWWAKSLGHTEPQPPAALREVMCANAERLIFPGAKHRTQYTPMYHNFYVDSEHFKLGVNAIARAYLAGGEMIPVNVIVPEQYPFGVLQTDEYEAVRQQRDSLQRTILSLTAQLAAFELKTRAQDAKIEALYEMFAEPQSSLATDLCDSVEEFETVRGLQEVEATILDVASEVLEGKLLGIRKNLRTDGETGRQSLVVVVEVAATGSKFLQARSELLDAITSRVASDSLEHLDLSIRPGAGSNRTQ